LEGDLQEKTVSSEKRCWSGGEKKKKKALGQRKKKNSERFPADKSCAKGLDYQLLGLGLLKKDGFLFSPGKGMRAVYVK